MEFAKHIEFNSPATVNKELTITYNGFLNTSNDVTIVYGFGESWEHTSEIAMTKTENGFCTKINMLNFETFNFCFKNSNNEWDNNYNCNYTSQILPCSSNEQVSAKFDIDALIEEILQPILTKQITEEETSSTVKISTKPVDLGVEISNILSEISEKETSENLVEYSSIDEILSCKVIDETPVELFENEENINQIKEETSLVAIEDPFIVSARQLSKFYSFRKHIKIALYKLFIKIPKLIFGSEEQ